MTSTWQQKIVDWQDFTGEGDVNTTSYASASRGVISTAYGSMNVGRIASRSGRYHYGMFRERNLNSAGEIGQDVNRNGVTNDEFPVLVVDANRSGVYDTVYVDTNRDYSFTDDPPLEVFADSGLTGRFADEQVGGRQGMPFVITNIRRDGGLVNLGFDGNGHGTHVAGIAASAGLFRAGAVGVAPGAKLMALKVLDSAGDGSWDSISRALVYAAEHGAKVASLSLATVNDNSSADSAQSQLIAELSLKYDLLIAIAAGNEGPGLSSALTPGDANEALTVGAYFSPLMWKHLYDLDVPHEGVWYYSAVGPRRDGSLAPNLVAPGAAISTVPLWLEPSGYELREGTSMSAPLAAGAAALLIQAASEAGLAATGRQVKNSLELGARSLDGYQAVEQGHGLIDLPAAWSQLQRMVEDSPKILTWVSENVPSAAGGTYARDFDPAGVGVTLENPGLTAVRMTLGSTADWVTADHLRMTVPAESQRLMYLNYDVPETPGLYSALVYGRGEASRADDMQFLSTVVRPYQFSGENDWRLRLNGTTEAAHYKRYFLEVPNGAVQMKIRLSIPSDGKQGYQGRAWMQINRPDGWELTRTDFIGLGSEQLGLESDLGASNGSGPTGQLPPPGGQNQGGQTPGTGPADALGSATVERVVEKPEAGVWEVVVYSSPALSRFGRDATVFGLDAELSGFEISPDSWRANVGSADNPTNQVAQEFSVTAQGLSFTGNLVGYGLSRGYNEVTTERATVTGRETFSKTLPDLPPGVAILKVSASNPSPEADLDLYLYRYDPVRKDWVAFGDSARPGVDNETIEVAQPPAGQYVVYVEAYGARSNISFELQTAQVPSSGQLATGDPAVTHPAGSTWLATMRANVPDPPGEYYGFLAVRDSKQEQTLALFPVFLAKGQPVLTIETAERRLTPGRAGEVNLELRDPDTGTLVSGLAIINGRTYEAVDGHLTIPVQPGTDGVTLQITASADDFGFSEYTLHVDSAPSETEAGGTTTNGAPSTRLSRLIEELRLGPGGQ
jgi:subtilisin family serine protease